MLYCTECDTPCGPKHDTSPGHFVVNLTRAESRALMDGDENFLFAEDRRVMPREYWIARANA